MSKLTILFDELDVGWVTLTIRWEDEAVIFRASYIYNSFHLLVDALIKLRLGEGKAVAQWNCEPIEYELSFKREGDIVNLDVLCFPDRNRSVFQQNIVLSITGSYEEICLPFWRALRNLQGRYPEAEIEEKWQGSFPSPDMKKLTAILGK